MKRFDAKNLDQLFAVLKSASYTIIGPTVRDQAIVYDEIDSAGDLPQGWTDEQEAGIYRLRRRADSAYFGFASSPHSWKQFLFPAKERLLKIEKDQKNGTLKFISEKREDRKLAFFGVRACDIAAIAVQDRTFIEGAIQDPTYKHRRENSLIIAVQCTSSSATCFCSSMHTGPGVRGGYDLVLTEVIDGAEHFFLIQASTAANEKVLNHLKKRGALSDAAPDAELRARAQVTAAGTAQRRRLDYYGVKDLLFRNFDSRRWDEVAKRCLNCANCTLACPTCFCASIDDTTDLTGDHAERWRRWDSCFTLGHSYIHGGPVRPSAKSRYRQWLTHKISSWWDQYGVSGCVGCGRCITWCPVGIDITEEAEAIREYENHRRAA